MGENDTATMYEIVATRKLMARHISRFGGRVVDAPGDALLAEFASAVESVRCAVAIQRAMLHRNAPLPDGRKMRLRIGINLGDVIERDSALYGEGVNVAARLQALGEPGGICISGAIHDQIEDRLPLESTFAGEHSVKNIAKPVRAFHICVASIPGEDCVHRIGNIELLADGRTLTVEGQPVKVGTKAFDVLTQLMHGAGRVVSRLELLDQVWPGAMVDESVVSAPIAELRRLLGPDAITTVPGLGYMLAPAGMDAPAIVSQSQTSQQTTSARPTTKATRTNLPSALLPLIGRSADRALLLHDLTAYRLVTLLGAGGIGKTRLAQEVAGQRIEAHADGVWWVDLASVSDGPQIAPAVAKAAQLQLGDGDAHAMLVRALAQHDVLLVLDNCEHVGAEVARLVQTALQAAPGLRVLATSQEPLRVGDEHLFRLDPLAVPDPGASLEAARRCGAVELLEARVQAIDRSFSLRADTVAAAIDICRHLDGIALAIEMAAARLPFIGMDALLVRLESRLQLLRANNRSAPSRQHTLRATLEWSHALLSAEERAVLRRLAVFAGHFRLETAQQVAAGTDIDEWVCLDVLGSLVDKSLVHMERREPPRYRLLETVKLYAMERLAAAGEIETAFGSHGRALMALAEEAERDHWLLSDQVFFERYLPDESDIQLAFDRACERRDVDVVAATGMTIEILNGGRSTYAVEQDRKVAAHALLPLARPLARARLWNWFCTYESAAIPQLPRQTVAAEALAASRTVRDARLIYQALWAVAVEFARLGQSRRAEECAAEANHAEMTAWPPRLRAFGAMYAATIQLYQADATGYRIGALTALTLYEEAGAMRAAAWQRHSLADSALMSGEYDEAMRLERQVIAELRELNERRNLCWPLANLCAAQLMSGQTPAALEGARQAWPHLLGMNRQADLFEHLALLAARLRRFEDAGRLLGMSDAWYQSSQRTRQPNEARLADMALAAIVSELSAKETERLRSAGAKADDAQAIVVAQRVLDGGGAQRTE